MHRIRILLSCGVFLVIGFLLPLQSTGTETIKIGFFEHKPHQYKIDAESKPRGATIVFTVLGLTVHKNGLLLDFTLLANG